MVEVRILFTEGCANTPQTIQRIRDVAQDMDVEVQVKQILVTSRDQAQELRFLGSPTVQIDGQDIDPVAREANSFGFT